jgi:hypothetical protein
MNDVKPKITMRFRWWVRITLAGIFLLSLARIRLPHGFLKFVCDRACEYRVGNGRWTPVTVDSEGT